MDNSNNGTTLVALGLAGLAGAAINAKLTKRRDERQRLNRALEAQEDEIVRLKEEIRKLKPGNAE